MVQQNKRFELYLETGKKKVFAAAVDWPGWSRSGRDETAAQEALLAYGPRYAQALALRQIPFDPPEGVEAFEVVERLEGGSGTDFGAPGEAPAEDDRPIDPGDLERLESILEACWMAFDAAVESAAGKELRKGPRGGGRETNAIVEHVLDADAAYLRRLGWKFSRDKSAALEEEMRRYREEVPQALGAYTRGELPAEGPRGGARWTARYFVRRSAWHVLDHAWEIEDRAEG